MKIMWTFTMLFLLMTRTAFTQSPAVDLAIIVTDNAGGQRELRFGLDSTATINLDGNLGEEELPPFPPPGVFEALFVGDDISLPGLGQGTFRDYLPSNVSGVLQDLLGGIVINKPMLGRDSLTVAIPGALNKLKMTINYAGIPNSVEQNGESIPIAYRMAQNYPNPFNPETSISYALPKPAHVVLQIYDILGRQVRTLVNETKLTGHHHITWNGRDAQGLALPSGIYLYKIQAGEFEAVRKMLLAK